MLDVKNSLVLMIDMQEKLASATNAKMEVECAKKLLTAANVLDIPLIVTEQYPKGLGGTCAELFELFGNNTKVFEKTSFSALLEPEILRAIKNTKRKQVILFGIELHICVYQTALDLLKKGYSVYIIKDASKSRSETNYTTGLEILKSKGAIITTFEIVLFELLKTSKHSEFKKLQGLIK